MNINETIDRLLGHRKANALLMISTLVFAGFQHNFDFFIEIVAFGAALLTFRNDWSWLGYIALGYILLTKLSIWQIPMGLVIYLLWRRASLYGEVKIPRFSEYIPSDDSDELIRDRQTADEDRLQRGKDAGYEAERNLTQDRKGDDDDRRQHGEPPWW